MSDIGWILLASALLCWSWYPLSLVGWILLIGAAAFFFAS